jgi:assimilatory nitrate reductase catalytic subunit
MDARAEPRVQVHPDLAARLGVGEEQLLRVESRRGAVEFAVALSVDIRRDTLFAPFHWGGRKAANLLTIAALDPVSRMPEFKVCAVRAFKASTEIEG